MNLILLFFSVLCDKLRLHILPEYGKCTYLVSQMFKGQSTPTDVRGFYGHMWYGRYCLKLLQSFGDQWISLVVFVVVFPRKVKDCNLFVIWNAYTAFLLSGAVTCICHSTHDDDHLQDNFNSIKHQVVSSLGKAQWYNIFSPCGWQFKGAGRCFLC